MRNLTIIRRKALACARAKLIIYMVDASADIEGGYGIMINGQPCGRLGTIENGGSLTVPIPECEVTIYAVISDTFSGVDNAHITIFPGSEDVLVTGKMSIFGLLTCVFFFDATPVLPTEKERAKRRAKEEKERKKEEKKREKEEKKNQKREDKNNSPF